MAPTLLNKRQLLAAILLTIVQYRYYRGVMSTHHVDHLVVGAGFGGLGAAIKLDEMGERDFLVVEKDGGYGAPCGAHP